jgi:predicted Zn-dependent protease with MMP-like domain
MDHTAPTCDDIEEIARATVASLPEAFRAGAADVALRVTDFPPEDILRDMEESDPFALTGLYDGVPLTMKSVMDVPTAPDTVWLFRRPLLDEWADRGDVPFSALVAHVTIHEFAHHFGWSDDDIAQIDRWWE